MTDRDWRLAVDIGGTFTDLVLVDASTGTVVVDKTLTTPSAPLEGVRRGVGQLLAKAGVRPSDITQPIVHATTLITNALIEGKTSRAEQIDEVLTAVRAGKLGTRIVLWICGLIAAVGAAYAAIKGRGQ